MQVEKLLENSMLPDAETRRAAEVMLKRMETSPGFVSGLLSILVTDSAVAHTAAIYLKNTVRSCWSATQNDKMISLEDRMWLKSNILVALVKITGPKRAQLLAATHCILTLEIVSESWQEFIPMVFSFVNSGDPHVVDTGMLLYLEFTKVYRWVENSKRLPFNESIRIIFPHLLQIAGKSAAVEQQNDQTENTIKIALKIYAATMRVDLTKHQQSRESLVSWCELIVKFIEMPQPQHLSSLTAETLETHIWWKAKKWAFTCLFLMMNRYARNRRTEPKYAAFAKMFLNEFAPNILKVYLRQVDAITQGVWVSSRVRQQLAVFIENCVKPLSTWPILCDHLEPIIVRFIFPQFCFSEEDKEMWDSDPVEFIHKQIDPPMDDFRSPRAAAEELLVTIARSRYKQSFVAIVTLINNILTDYNSIPESQRNPRIKYGAISMMSALADQALDDQSPIKLHMEQFMVTHIFPEFLSLHGFIRSIACDCFLKLSGVTYTNPANFSYAFENIMNMLLHDKELPVKINAALTISAFVDNPNSGALIRPQVALVMQQLLNLTNQIDMDTLTNVMEQLVFEYAEELAPFASQVCIQLIDTFMRIMGDLDWSNPDLDPEETEPKITAGMGVLKTVSSLILAIEASKTIVIQLQEIAHPAICLVLQHSILDLFEEVFEIIETATFCSKQITETCWSYFPHMYRTFTTDGCEYLEEMLPTLDNYITFGRDRIVKSPEILQAVVTMIMNVLNTPKGEARESDYIRACQLIESLLLNIPGIDSLIPRFIEISYTHFVTRKPGPKTMPLKIHLLEIVINCLKYNAKHTLEILESCGWLILFLETWFVNLKEFVRVHDKKLSVIAICAIFEIPITALPFPLQNGWVSLFAGMLKILKSYPEALEERNLQQRIEDGEDEAKDDEYDENETVPFNQSIDAEIDDDGQLNELAGDAAAAYQYQDDFGEENEDEDDEDWSVADFMIEDIYFSTNIDEVNIYDPFKHVITLLTNQGRIQELESFAQEIQVIFASSLAAPIVSNQG